MVRFSMYLGVILGEIFTCKKHVDHIGQSLVKYFGILNQINCKVTSQLSSCILLRYRGTVL